MESRDELCQEEELNNIVCVALLMIQIKRETADGNSLQISFQRKSNSTLLSSFQNIMKRMES